MDATERYELLTRLEGMPKHTKLCHGDFNPSNVIVEKNGKMTVIDWAHASQGNASADAAMTYLLFALHDQESADLYLKLFCKKSDTVCRTMAANRSCCRAWERYPSGKRLLDEMDRCYGV